MLAWNNEDHVDTRGRADPRAGRPGGRRADAEDAGRGTAVPARPVHPARAGGAHPSLADGAAAGRARAVPRDRRARPDEHGDGDAGRAVASKRHGRLPDGTRPRPRAAAAALVERNGFTRAGSDGRLTLAVPSKGRMAEPALRLCADAGLSFEITDRSLLVPCANAPVDLLLVRAGDVPEYVQDGVVDLGITGANLVVEAAADVVTLAELGFARCTLQAAVPEAAPQAELRDLAGLRVATAYPASTRACLAERGVEVELVPVSGSVEAAPRLGLSDAIVDLVSTGSTASANGLRPLGTLLESQAVLIGNSEAQAERQELVERLELMLSGVVAARRRRYLMLNVPVGALERVEELIPGMGSPSVLDLAEEGMKAVHAAVDADEIWSLLPALKAAGASSILVLPVERLVPGGGLRPRSWFPR